MNNRHQRHLYNPMKLKISILNSSNSEFSLACEFCKELAGQSHQSYIVGGYIRDLILDSFSSSCANRFFLLKKQRDLDISTNVPMDEIRKRFKTYELGSNFGTLNVSYNGYNFEVSQFRRDGDYSDGRHPDSVGFSTPEEDAQRRDFTINGIFYDPLSETVIDYANGLEDLQNGIIRCIGVPYDRFSEDYLRMLRAIRFAVSFNFTIDDRTGKAIRENAYKITRISQERIIKEFLKILNVPNPGINGIQVLHEYGLLKYIIPECLEYIGCGQPEKWHPEGDVWTHTMIMINGIGEDYKDISNPSVFPLAVLLHDVGKPATKCGDHFLEHDMVGAGISEDICRRLKLSNEETNMVSSLVRMHMRSRFFDEMRRSKKKKLVNEKYFNELMELFRLDCISSKSSLDTYYNILNFKEETPPEIIKPEPIIRGGDLLELGFKAGPIIGQILNNIMDLQLEEEINTKEEAINHVLKNWELPK